MKQSSESSAALFDAESAPAQLAINPASEMNSLPRQFREHCRWARTLRKSILLAFTPSSSAARHSLRRAQPTGAPGPIAYVPRSRIAPSLKSPSTDSQRPVH